MYKRVFKRLFDILISLLAFPFFMLIFIPLFILIKVEDGGPVFYTSNRIGKNKVLFRMFKFRTMNVNAPDIRLKDGSTYNSRDDTRVTRLGRILRESSFDELPQIMNILVGDMSLIGPRPDVVSNEKYPEELSSFFSVRPGLTGFNQAFFRNETNRLEKMKNDKYYAENLTFFLDIRIFIKTISVIMLRKGIYKKNSL